MNDTVNVQSVEKVVREAGKRVLELRSREINAIAKQGLDIVTRADVESQDILLDGLALIDPEAVLLSEEQDDQGANSSAQRAWVIDPLDGTVNYAAGLPWYSISVAYRLEGKIELGCIYMPAADRIFHFDRRAEKDQQFRVTNISTLSDAVVSVILTGHFDYIVRSKTVRLIDVLSEQCRGVRVIVSGAYELALVATGCLDGFISAKSDRCSVAAGLELVKRAGGQCTTFTGESATEEDSTLIVGNAALHPGLQQLVMKLGL